eukprot:TRINITY_DN28873_c0_g1_i1.p1 TRINITY_DN28873_c0_g1~~TRINITY_DN28873_c0_g1_i1.p1  ORF type:complete len:259 (-),score=52.35 TRINITY_DN28873_c0_g1_i1:355-1131(-)
MAVQNLFVMRHGERLDNCDPQWVRTAPRPWDPPLTERGKIQAWNAGKRLRAEGWNITRVFSSPFLRCVQTTAEVVSALCAVHDDAHGLPGCSSGVSIDPSRVKVSIEYGLCEVLNYLAIRCPPTSDASWILDHFELEAILPAGTIDRSVEPLWKELPKWQETTEGAHNRYSTTIKALADKFPQENVICVTHGEGVGVSVSSFVEDVFVYSVDYCAYSHAQRSITNSMEGTLDAGKFNVLTESGHSGILFNKRGMPKFP